MKLYRYLGPGGHKFTSCKLVVNFMKEKGYNEDEERGTVGGLGRDNDLIFKTEEKKKWDV